MSRIDLLIKSLEKALQLHRKLADDEQKEYKSRIKAVWHQFAEEIIHNSISADLRRERLCSAMYEACIAFDFQMGKLVPHWGQTPQPGKTYYSPKVMNHIFGVVNSAFDENCVYLNDETAAGEKDATHVCSYLHHYLHNVLHPDVKFLRVYLDAAGYFKSQYILGFFSEMVLIGRLDRVVLSFMVPGHTKFEPDSLFSRIAHKFQRSDVFNTPELVQLVRSCGTKAIELPLKLLRLWKETLSAKYSDLKDIQSFNYFVISLLDNENSEIRNVSVQMKRSLTCNEFEKIFNRRTSTHWNPLKGNASPSQMAAPTEQQSAADMPSMRKPFNKERSVKINELYSTYIPRERVQPGLDEDPLESDVQTRQSAESSQREQAVRVGELLGREESMAQAFSLLTRSGPHTDSQIIRKIRLDRFTVIRKMPRRKRS